MKIKIKYNKLTFVLCLCLALGVMACQSHEVGADEAFERFKTKRTNAVDTVYSQKSIVVLTENQSQQMKLNSDLEIKLDANKNAIKYLLKANEKNADKTKKLLKIEKSNTKIQKDWKEFVDAENKKQSDYNTQSLAEIEALRLEIENLKK